MSRATLGQHFLVNKDKLREIADALDLKFDDTVIEIGPGHGELTGELKAKSLKLKIIAIEKDKNLAKLLKEKFAADKNVEIMEGDALKILPKLITQLPDYSITNYKIVGNIPYYITGYLLRILEELITNYHLPITVVVLLIQKEVAERICVAVPKMNLLAASVQFWAEPEIVGYVPRKDFQPMPKVDSAIIKLTPHKITDYQLPIANYYKFIKILFRQPRKTIINNSISNFQFLISKQELAEKLRKIGIEPDDRPQDLSVEEIKKMAESLEKYIIQQI